MVIDIIRPDKRRGSKHKNVRTQAFFQHCVKAKALNTSGIICRPEAAAHHFCVTFRKVFHFHCEGSVSAAEKWNFPFPFFYNSIQSFTFLPYCLKQNEGQNDESARVQLDGKSLNNQISNRGVLKGTLLSLIIKSRPKVYSTETKHLEHCLSFKVQGGITVHRALIPKQTNHF